MKFETESIDDEISLNGSRKIVLGIRCYPELKNKLTQEAFSLGLTLSEHAENILLNRDRVLISNQQAHETVNALKQQLTQLAEEKTVEIRSWEDACSRLTEENKGLQLNTTSATATHDDLLNDVRLLELFSALKGRSDQIETEAGLIPTQYNSPADLIRAMIYSYKLK